MRRTSVFANGENLGAGAIHLPRACEIISRGPPRNPGFRGGLTSSWTSSILCVLRKRRTRRSNRLFPKPAKECGKPGGVLTTPPGFCISPLHTNHPPQAPGIFGGMAPTAARRARPVQRSSYQGLRGNPDACRPRRGSACDVSSNRAGGDTDPVFAGPVQATAALDPGSRARRPWWFSHRF